VSEGGHTGTAAGTKDLMAGTAIENSTRFGVEWENSVVSGRRTFNASALD